MTALQQKNPPNRVGFGGCANSIVVSDCRFECTQCASESNLLQKILEAQIVVDIIARKEN